MKKNELICILLAVLTVLSVFIPVISSAENDNTKQKDIYAEIADEYTGNRIGVVVGSVFDQIAEKYIPDAALSYINTSADCALALETGKIDAYLADEPVARLYNAKYNKHYIEYMLEETDYGYIFPKNSERSDLIREQLSSYIRTIKVDGTLKKIDGIWFGDDEEVKNVDYGSLIGENGTITFGVCSDVGAPFVYMKDNKYVGYDVDIAVRFCKEYGYDLKIVDLTLAGLLSSVTTGKCDFGASTIALTEERSKTMNFSEPNYRGGVVLVTRDGSASDVPFIDDPDIIEQLNGKTIGSITGVVENNLSDYISDYKMEYYNSAPDFAAALEAGKIDAYYYDGPIAKMLVESYSNHRILCWASYNSCGFIFAKNNEKSEKLLEQFNAFLEGIIEDGTLEEIKTIWFGNDESLKTVDFNPNTGENGTLEFAVSTAVGDPFCYMKDQQIVGYDIDLAVRFAREYGYSLHIVDNTFSGLLTGVSSGKFDFGGSSVIISEARKETMNFSIPTYECNMVIVVNGAAETTTFSGIIGRIYDGFTDSFYRTFTEEDRWFLFVNGISVTICILVFSVFFGTVFGFGFFLVYRKQNKLANAVLYVLSAIMEKTPIVVVLMILYYVILRKISLDSIIVSIIGFSVLFACSVLAIFKTAVDAVDKNQMEAALALGYGDTHAFLRIILPQAIRFFLPVYKMEIVSLLKNTAVVGYIAVQDLTKVSDIVRSRTFEAFFPLIASAVFYFIIAWLIGILIKRIQINTDPKLRKIHCLLRGIKQNVIIREKNDQ